MPLYDYKCVEHGLFHELATMEQSALPCSCPQCGVSSPRVILIPPEVLDMAPAKRSAIAKNERAANEPVIYTRETSEEMRERHAHMKTKGKSCGCSDHPAAGDRGALQQKAVFLADGSKVFPSQRPWMISH